MPALYVTEQAARLEKDGEAIRIVRGAATLLRVPVHLVDRVLIFGNAQVTTQALSLLLSRGADVSFLSQAGRLKGRVVPPFSPHASLRLAQYECVLDSDYRLATARTIVRAKLRNSSQVLRRMAHNRRGETALRECVATVRRDLERLAARTESARDLDTLRGLEGAGAARYFRAWFALLPPDLTPGQAPARTRVRRPPRDPANALLSLGYTLLGNELTSLLAALGLDPYLGFLHEANRGQPALALDLMEEFRAPAIDRLAATLLNRRALTSEDFAERDQERGRRLLPGALQRYLHEYEKTMQSAFAHSQAAALLPGARETRTTLRRMLALQARRFARALSGGALHAAFCWR
jgi:CRISPR-associated protein Cas1